MSKIVCIVQARVSSSRLYRKVLLPLAGYPVIWHVFNQLSFSKFINEFVLATSIDKSDDELVTWAIENKILYYRGDLNNVLRRYYETAINFSADIIVRITADCPLIDPLIVDNVIKEFLSDDYDYYSNTNPPTFPDGLDTEVFSFYALKEAYLNARLKSEIEHVTSYIKNNINKFRIGNLLNEINYDYLRLTLDTKEDYKLLKIIFENLFRHNSFIPSSEVINFLENNKRLLEINSSIKRNEGYLKSKLEDGSIL